MAEYDEATCVTAGELRARGIDVPETIPDVGWIPRSALLVEPGELRLDGNVLHCEMTITFAVPFKWFECNVKIETDR